MRRVFENFVTAALRRLEPETAHRGAVALLRHIPMPPPEADPASLSVEAFGLRFANPLGLAAGFDKDAVVVSGTLRLGFGFTEVGTLTPKPQSGNSRPRVFRLADQGAVINRYGFNNAGHAAAHGRLAALTHRSGPVGINLGANKDAADRTADYVAGIIRFADVADYFTLNVSSPNTPGLRDLQATTALLDLLARTVAARDSLAPRYGRKPLLLKIAPDLDLASLDDIVHAVRLRAIDGIIVSNTTVARPSSLMGHGLEKETGGLSGRPLFPASTRMLAQTYLRVGGQIPLIGVGGIDSAHTAIAKVRAGATLIQIYSGLVFAGTGLVADIKTGLAEHLRQAGTPLHAQVGADAASWQHDGSTP